MMEKPARRAGQTVVQSHLLARAVPTLGASANSVQVPLKPPNRVHRDGKSDLKLVAVFVKFGLELTCCSTIETISGFLLLRFK